MAFCLFPLPCDEMVRKVSVNGNSVTGFFQLVLRNLDGLGGLPSRFYLSYLTTLNLILKRLLEALAFSSISLVLWLLLREG